MHTHAPTRRTYTRSYTHPHTGSLLPQDLLARRIQQPHTNKTAETPKSLSILTRSKHHEELPATKACFRQGNAYRSLKWWHSPCQCRKSRALCLGLSEYIGFFLLSTSLDQRDKTTVIEEGANLSRYLQHSIGFDAACREMILPLASGMCTRKTSRTRVFFLPMSVSPLRSSMSAFLSFRIPAQSMLPKTCHLAQHLSSQTAWK